MEHLFVKHSCGRCDNCGTEDVDLCCIPDYMWLCKDCFGDMDWCDICGQGYVDGAVEFVETDDGKYICEYCADELMDEKSDEG